MFIHALEQNFYIRVLNGINVSMRNFNLSLARKRAPFVFVILPFITGIWVAHTWDDNRLLFVICIFITGLGLLWWNRRLKITTNYMWGIVLLMVLCCAGYIHYEVYHDKHLANVKTDREFMIRAVCLDKPQKTQYGYKCEIQVTRMGNKAMQHTKPFKAIVFFERGNGPVNLTVGDHIMAYTRFRPVRNRGNPHEFDYQRFQSLRDIYYSASIGRDNWTLLPRKSMPLKRFAVKSRDVFKQNIDMSFFEEREKAILTAMCLGDKSDMEERTLSLFKRMGIAHLFAVSGLHVGFVFLLFRGIFRQLAYRSLTMRVISVCIPVFAIWLFTLITGLPDSAVRASIMFSIIALGDISGKRYFAINNLAIAAFIILLINPKQVFQIGFQLSFLAVLGILLLFDKINKAIYFSNYLLRKMWELISVSIAAQFLIFPLLLYHFHQFSFAFVITNIIATPVAALLLYGGLLLNILSVLPWLKLIIGYMIKSIFSLFLFLLDSLEHFTWFFADHIFLTYPECIVLMTIVLVIVLVIHSFQAKWIIISLSLLLVFFSLILYRNLGRTNQSALVAYNIPQSSTISIITGKDHFLLTDTVILRHPDKEDYYLGGHYLATGTYKSVIPLNINANNDFVSKDIAIRKYQGHCWVRLKDKTVLVAQQPILSKEEYKTDVLLIRNYNRFSIKPLLENINPGVVVFDNTVPAYRIPQWKAECKSKNQDYHHIYEEGAFILPI